MAACQKVDERADLAGEMAVLRIDRMGLRLEVFST